MGYKDALYYTAQALNKNMSSKTTGFTPHQLASGDTYNTPFDNLLRKYILRADRIKKTAIARTAEAKDIQKMAYNKGKTDRFFKVGDLVWLLNVRRNGQGKDYWTQSRVVHSLPNDNYIVWDEDNYTPVRANISQLSQYDAPTILPGSNPLSNIAKVINEAQPQANKLEYEKEQDDDEQSVSQPTAGKSSYDPADLGFPRPKFPNLDLFFLNDKLFPDEVETQTTVVKDVHFGKHISYYFPESRKTYRGIVGLPTIDDPDGTHNVIWDDGDISPIFMDETKRSYEDNYKYLTVKPTLELTERFDKYTADISTDGDNT
jgi:hypothetical protein